MWAELLTYHSGFEYHIEFRFVTFLCFSSLQWCSYTPVSHITQLCNLPKNHILTTSVSPVTTWGDEIVNMPFWLGVSYWIWFCYFPTFFIIAIKFIHSHITQLCHIQKDHILTTLLSPVTTLGDYIANIIFWLQVSYWIMNRVFWLSHVFPHYN